MEAVTLDLDIVPSTVSEEIPDEAMEHGEVFTREWVVAMILDLVDYRSDRDLAALRLVEPACGTGAFLAPIARRVSESCRKHGRSLREASGAVTAFDLLPRNIVKARALVERTFAGEGWGHDEASAVAKSWIRRADYLLRRADKDQVDFVVGNPPYIELIPT